jgi:hypothetical protein
MPDTWTREKLEKLSIKELVTLERNVRERNHPDLGDLCFQVRLPRLSKAAQSKALALFNFENEVASYLGAAAKSLNKEFDLSIEMATRRKTPEPHALTDKRGDAKSGGAKRSIKFALYRYISYRLINAKLEATAMLHIGKTIDQTIYAVIGTPDVVTEGTRIDGLELAKGEVALTFPTLEAAVIEYTKLLGTFAPRRY